MRTTLDIQHTGNLDGERTRMTFDENATAHLMSVLTDLYSDKELAIIREYSTNAWDSHVAAGNPDPIEIELPTQLRQVYVVRDRGLGMSAEQVVDQFSKYGFSSKRDTDEQTGMLGLGCKSALSLTSQFTMTCIKDGIKNLILVTREEDGAGAVQLIYSEETDEPNGVEVEIPIGNRIGDFCTKARKFFQFWEKGTVMVDGSIPITVFERAAADELDPSSTYRYSNDNRWKPLILDPDVMVLPRNDNVWGHTVIMGNVPYPIHARTKDETPSPFVEDGTIVVARVPIGSLNFPPSRETVQFTKRTKETLATIREFVSDRWLDTIQASIDDAPNVRAAYRRVQKHAGSLRIGRSTGSFRYKGVRYEPYELASQTRSWTLHVGKAGIDEYGHKTHQDGVTHAEIDSCSVVVTGYPGEKMGRVTLVRLDRWLEMIRTEKDLELEALPSHVHSNNPYKNVRLLLTTETNLKSKFLPKHVFTWQDVLDGSDLGLGEGGKLAKYKLIDQTSPRPKRANPLWVAVDKVPDSGVVGWMPATRSTTQLQALADHFKAGEVLVVSGPARKRFELENMDQNGTPKIPSIEIVVKNRFRELAVQAESRPVVSPHSWIFQFVDQPLLDTELLCGLKAIRKKFSPGDPNPELDKLRRLAGVLKIDVSYPYVRQSRDGTNAIVDLFKKYPLAIHLVESNLHGRGDSLLVRPMVEYMNAIYAMREGLHLHPKLY